jgi:SpoVK/Ycf46/Vps4 family AAA+-type ATPase
MLRSTQDLGDDTPHQLLFAGPAGTVKTLAIHGLAGQLGRPLLRIDVSQIMSKYIGETEKNLARVLKDAAGRQTILFFDEADALFGGRTKVRSSTDRSSGLEGPDLLDLIEKYPGLVVIGMDRVHDLSKKRQIVKFNRR